MILQQNNAGIILVQPCCRNNLDKAKFKKTIFFSFQELHKVCSPLSLDPLPTKGEDGSSNIWLNWGGE